MTTTRKQENEKITTEKENKNRNLTRIIEPWELEFQDSNSQICEHCRDTGVNLKFVEVNKIINAISDYTYKKRRVDYNRESDVPYCKCCFGGRKIDREKHISYHCNSYNDLEIFLIYVANCETIYDCDKETAMHYDILDDSWKEYNGSFNMEEAKLNLVNYMREFRDDGYFDVSVNSAKNYFYRKNVFKRWIGLETIENRDICSCCHRHCSELKRFKEFGDPEDGDFTGPYIIDSLRPLSELDKISVKAFLDAYRFNKNDIGVTKKWLIKKYGKERAEEIIIGSDAKDDVIQRWECRDCFCNKVGLQYFVDFNKNELSLYLDKEYNEKLDENELSSDLDKEYFEKKNKMIINFVNEYFEKKNKPFSFQDIKF